MMREHFTYPKAVVVTSRETLVIDGKKVIAYAKATDMVTNLSSLQPLQSQDPEHVAYMFDVAVAALYGYCRAYWKVRSN